MTNARIEHVFDCRADTYWSKVFFDEEYNRRAFFDALGFDSWKVESQDETDDQIKRVVKAVPKIPDLPGPLKRLTKGGVGYTEYGTFDKKTQRFSIRLEPDSMGDKLKMSGEISTESVGDAKCNRIYTTTAEAKIFGIGKMVEKRVLEDVRKSYDLIAKFTKEFIAEKGL